MLFFMQFYHKFIKKCIKPDTCVRICYSRLLNAKLGNYHNIQNISYL